MPPPRKGEQQKDYVSRCMSSEEAKKDFPDTKQRVAFCNSKWENKGKSSAAIFIYEDPKTGELFHYSRRGAHRKNGRTLIFVKQSRAETILDKTAENYIAKKNRDNKE